MAGALPFVVRRPAVPQVLTFGKSEDAHVGADAIAALVNRAFEIESWFAEGDRTTPQSVQALLDAQSAVFFVAVDRGALVGCVYAERRGAAQGYIGLLAVDDARHGQGIGTRLMVLAEQHLEQEGCDAIDLTVVNLREELFPFYERRGYRSIAELPFPRPSRRPCHLVSMTRSLRSAG